MSAAALGISAQTLRYWRENLDPDPRNGDFSGGRLLAYRVLKMLIRQRFFPVEGLKRCDWVDVFEACEHVALGVLARCYLYIDVVQGIVFLHNAKPYLDEQDNDPQVIPMIDSVAQHRQMLENMGADVSQRRYQLAPTTAEMIVRHAPIVRRKGPPNREPFIDLSVLDDC